MIPILCFLALHSDQLPVSPAARPRPGLYAVQTARDMAASTRTTWVSVAFSHDQKRIAILYADNTIVIQEISNGASQQTLVNRGYGSRSLLFSPNDRFLAVGAFRELILWDLDTQQSLLPSDVGECVSSMAFSPYGNTLLYTTMEDLARTFDIRTRTSTPLSFVGLAYLPVYSPDGRRAAGHLANQPGSWKSDIGVWDAHTGKLVRTLPGETQWGGTCLFLGNTQLLTTEDNGRLKVWNPQTGKLLRVLHEAMTTDDDVSSGLFATTSDGTLLASTYGTDVSLWSPHTGKLRRKLPEPHAVGLAFSSDGRWLFTATTDGHINRWNVRTGAVNQLVALATLYPQTPSTPRHLRR